jgi:hypothetical protein
MAEVVDVAGTDFWPGSNCYILHGGGTEIVGLNAELLCCDRNQTSSVSSRLDEVRVSILTFKLITN